MLVLPNYRITDVIYQDPQTTLYRAIRTADRVSVIVKTASPAYPDPSALARLQHEYQVLHDLDLPGVVKAYALEPYQHGLALIRQDVAGQPLSALLAAGPLDLRRFFPLARALAHILGALHQHSIIHKDVKPHNILLDPQTGQVHLTDFDLSTRLSHEQAQLIAPDMIEGTLAYIAPEQTGRMNRLIDYRTDLYSLGVTLYEALTGSLPFDATDPLELVHSHIARVPLAPHVRVPGVPPVLSAIVMKLLAKTAEERYQSGYGLHADLERCQAAWVASGAVADFDLGQHDLAATLQVSQQLYGREAELTTLLAAFERVSQGAAELLLVEGYAGVGKTALIHELHKPLVRQRGYFLSGKFDQLRQNVPYDGLIQAFQALVRQMLAESDAQIARWKAQLLAALGTNGQIIVEVIPEVALIIGPQPPVPPLGLTEAQNRFTLTFHNFIAVFTSAAHPLILFLDDLQWADAASLSLLQRLMTDPTTHHLLMIGAYRDTEVSAADPLALTLSVIEKGGTQLGRLTLQPLDLEHLSALLADTLRCAPAAVVGLAGLIHKKTGGNPFFVNQFVHALYEAQLLFVDAHQGAWQWDLARIEGLGITDNVVELMAGKFQKLAAPTQQVARLAASIGNRFDLATLARISEQSVGATAAALWPAVQEGLVVPVGQAYQVVAERDELPGGLEVEYHFLHDRVQQAAYSLIAEAERGRVHVRIGRLLLAQADLASGEERLFDIVNQLNLGRALIVEADERAQVAGLNRRAGQKARASLAYAAATSYFAAGIALLAEERWEEQYELAFALHRGQAECAYLSGQLDQAEVLFETLLAHARSRLDQAEVYNLRMVLYTSLGKFPEAVASGCAGLQLFGIMFPEATAERQAAVGAAIGEAQRLRNGRGMDELFHAPRLTDPEQLAQMTLLMNLCPSAYFMSQELFGLVALQMAQISLREGHTALSSFGYLMYAQILGSVLEQYQDAYTFGLLALQLNETFNIVDLTPRLYYLFGTAVAYWHEPLSACDTYLQQAYQLGLAAGDFLHVGYASGEICVDRICKGDSLQEVADELDRYRAFLQRTNDSLMIACLTVVKQWILCLQGQTQAPDTFDDASFQTAPFLEQMQQAGLGVISNCYFIARLQQLVFQGIYLVALDMAREAERTAAAAAGHYWLTELVFYTALTLTALYPDATPEEQAQYDAELDRHQARLKAWAEIGPANFLVKYELVAAERARIRGDTLAALDAYDQAIETAREYGFPHIAALASERAGSFYLARGKPHKARTYLADACAGYLRWGATAVAQRLEAAYPQLLAGMAGASVSRPAPSLASPASLSITTSSHTAAGVLDLAAIMKAAYALSSEIVLENLLHKVMAVVLEAAGAQTGHLILEQGGRLTVAAARNVEQDAPTQALALPVEESADLSAAIVQYVARTREAVVLQDAAHDEHFARDPYIVARRPKSVVCLPLTHQGQLAGIVYLENNLTTGAFTRDRLDLLQLLAAQAAISLQNARLYAQVQAANATLEQKVVARTAEAQAARAAAEQANELKTKFLANMSHELRTPLNSIINFTRIVMAGMRGPVNEAQHDYLDRVRLSGEHLLGLINDILDLAKIEAGRMDLFKEPLAIGDLVRGVLATAAGLTKDKPIELAQEFAPDLPSIEADRTRIRQVLLNLLSNAAKFTDTGTITVRVYTGQRPDTETGDKETRRQEPAEGRYGDQETIDEPGSPSPGLPVSPSGGPSFVVIEVQDSGIGIAPEHLATIFEEFRQVDDARNRRYEGTGLGLAICKRLVEMHGGRMWIESTVGVGSTFAFSLPLPRLAAPAAGAAPALLGLTTAGIPILVIDDDPQAIEIVAAYLGRDGYAVHGLTDSRQALSAVRQIQPAALLLDMLMPHQDGWDVLANLKADPDLRTLPVVFYTITEEQKLGFALGASAYLVKPVSEELLRSTIAGLVARDGRILVIDDDPQACEIVTRQLEAGGAYQVATADGGQAGLEAIVAAPPDLIILDLMMPVVDGFAVLAQLDRDASTRAIPVVVLTAKELTRAEQTLLQQRVLGLLTKGVTAPEQLLYHVNNVLGPARDRPGSR